MFVRSGPVGGEPALFVHGLGGSSNNWTDLIALLEGRLAAEAMDLPGFGRSAPPREGYRLGAHVRAVVQRIEARGDGPVHLFGNSLGGAVSTLVAAKRPDLVRTLTLVSPALPSLRPRRGSDPRLPLLLLPGLETLARRQLASVPPEQRARAVVQLCWADPSRLSPERLAEAVEEVRRRSGLGHDAEAFTRSLRGLVGSYLARGPRAMWRQAGRVAAPTLLVWGAQDRLVDVSLAPRAARTFPDARLLVLDDVGHVAQMERPDLVARAFLGLLEEEAGVQGGPGNPSAAVRLSRRAVTRRSAPTMSLPPLVEPAAELSREEVMRYSRHLIIPDVATTGQKRLKNSRVLIIGAGGLGSPALLYLAAAGVGTLGIVDFDVVDESNLQRQVIHGQSDIGRSKAESARDSVLEINPLVEVVLHQERLESTNVYEVFEQYDLIVDGTDNFATRYLVNDAAFFLGKPYVWGSIYRFDGQASVFWPTAPGGDAPCYRCLYPEPPPPGMVPSCAEGGVLGVLCASIGAIQSTEAVKLLMGIGEPLVGTLMVYDALEMEYRRLTVRKDPECPLCGKNPTITGLIDYEAFCGTVSEEAQQAAAGSTILASELKAKMDAGEDFLLVDVREPAEYEIVQVPGSVLIPKGEILNGSALAGLPQDRQIVLYCKSGVRSAEALAALKAAGLTNSVHVQGGVLAWQAQVDPSLPTY